jgi:hypothetical protein
LSVVLGALPRWASSLSVQPSPVNRRVGIHNFTFEACSSFTRVTACKVACPPKGGLLSRGFDPASCPTALLGSYHVSPTTTCVDPPSTGDLRRWGAPLTRRADRALTTRRCAESGRSIARPGVLGPLAGPLSSRPPLRMAGGICIRVPRERPDHVVIEAIFITSSCTFYDFFTSLALLLSRNERLDYFDSYRNLDPISDRDCQRNYLRLPT